jgi:hypothetical protein
MRPSRRKLTSPPIGATAAITSVAKPACRLGQAIVSILPDTLQPSSSQSSTQGVW